MSEQLYITNDLIKATGRPQVTLNTACQRGNVGTKCGIYRVFTDYEFTEICRLDRLAKEQKTHFETLVIGFFSNRKATFPYIPAEQVAANVGTTKTAIGKWIGKGMLEAVRVGTPSRPVLLLDKENYAKAKRLAEELRLNTPERLCKPAESIVIDPSMLKFSITREGAKKLLEYLKQQLGEN